MAGSIPGGITPSTRFVRVTRSPARESQVAWTPDSRRVVYASERNGVSQLFMYDFTMTAETQITSADVGDSAPRVSPDGKSLAFVRDGKELRVLDLTSKQDRVVATGFLARGPRGVAWSPDNRWVAYIGVSGNAFRNVFVVPAQGGLSRAVTAMPNGSANNISWSPDGTYLLYNTNQRTEESEVVRVDLILRTPTFREDRFRDLFKDEPAVARQLTSSAGEKADAQFTPDGREVFFLEQGRISVIPVETRVSRSVAVTAELDVDFATEKMEVFRQAWTYLRDGFYDEGFHGVDWNAVRAEYAPRIAGAQTPAEMRRLLNLMVGELNASHMGVATGGGGGGGGGETAAGNLGLSFDRREFEEGGRLKVTGVVPLGPAAITKQIAAGDLITAVDGQPIGARTNLDQLLLHTANRRVALTVSSPLAGVAPREVIVRPISQGAEKNLRYREWVESNRAYVERASNGRLGYVHMNDMSEGALRRLYLDLDADNRVKEGVVVDVRNNNGGFVNVYAIDVLARRGYMMMTPRGLPKAPARTVLGQRALELPTILVTNQHSLSDAEDFTEGYRTLKLGKVVGEPTSGWIIYTGGQTLVDGSTIRMPFTRITTLDGATMELNPRRVDVAVTRPIGETLAGKDSQLDTAVRELLKQLGS